MLLDIKTLHNLKLTAEIYSDLSTRTLLYKFICDEIKRLESGKSLTVEPQTNSPADEEEVKYGDYVEMTDRFNSVHIWSEELEKRNAGRWKPYKITKEKFDEEMKKSWNNFSANQSFMEKD